MRILIAPDKFRGALGAARVAEALAEGVRDALPAAETVLCPLGDGGEGTGELLAQSCGAETWRATVRDPLGRERVARWWCDAARGEAIVEMAEPSGLCLLCEAERDPTRTTSFGTGQLIQAAIDAGCRQVTLCVGGSATVDGGAGCLQALGWRLLDATGAALVAPVGGAALSRIARVVAPSQLRAVGVTVLCDVNNPLLGRRGAAAVFAPQKGASAEQVALLEDGLRRWAGVLRASSGRDVRELAGAGAAGGLPAGLAAALHATLVSGFDEAARRLGLRGLARGCELCLTGEGRIDEQTTGGKVVAGVARMARDLQIPVVALTGAVDATRLGGLDALARAVGVDEIVVVTPPGTPADAALRGTADNVRRAVRAYLPKRV